MQGGYNMYIRCNQKFMFCKDHGIDFGVWLCREYARYTLGEPLMGISTLQPGTFMDFHFTYSYIIYLLLIYFTS